jgi:ClpX C4-type zinc finger/Sigma-70 region 2
MESATKRCSFCAKPEKQAGRLVFGPNSVAICQDCAAIAFEQSRDQSLLKSQSPVRPPVKVSPPARQDVTNNEGHSTLMLSTFLEKVPFISFEEERVLLEGGEEESLEKVARSYLPLVGFVVSKYSTSAVDSDDILQEVMLHLMKWIRTRGASRNLSELLADMEAAARAVGAGQRENGGGRVPPASPS